MTPTPRPTSTAAGSTELHLAEDSEKKLLKEVDRLAKMQGSNQEATVIRTYLGHLP